jgi:hypothetical protein
MIDAVNARIAKTSLETRRIFPQIMQQAGEAGFITCAERCGEFRGEISDVAEVIAQELPLAGILGERPAVFILRSVCVVDHRFKSRGPLPFRWA